MNLSKIAIDNVSLEVEEPRDITPQFQEREQKLIRILEAIAEIQSQKAWSSLKAELFDELPRSLESQITKEAKKENPNISKLNSLSGELKWAERFSDLSKLHEQFRVELTNVRQTLYGTS